jgi:hypothetical protein
MKDCKLTVIVSLFLFLVTWADAVNALTCPVSGTINADCSWTLSDSPVSLGSINIQTGVSATAEPGVSLILSVDDIDVYGTLNIGAGSLIAASDNHNVADIRVQPSGTFNMSDTSAIDYSGSGRVTVDIYGTAVISGATLDVQLFKVYSGATGNITNTTINAGTIAFYKGSDYTLSGNTLKGGVFVDSDGDGVPDDQDNCIEVPNPDQADANSGEDDNIAKAGEQHYGNKCDPDFDNSGIVNIIDFNEWRKYTGQSVPPAPESIDISGDGLIWIQDFNIWRQYYGKAPGPGVGD